VKREKHTILLVEDNEDDQQLIAKTFRANGVKDPIHAVADGEEAIAYLKGMGQFADRRKFEFPSFIITDLKMPRVDGFGVLEALRDHPQWAIIPTVVLSGSADEDDIKHAYLLGAKSFLQKPSDFGEFRRLLKSFHEYWTEVHVPRSDEGGTMLHTESKGKIGERFSSS
jgi:CheY-like chemotaxis protein